MGSLHDLMGGAGDTESRLISSSEPTGRTWRTCKPKWDGLFGKHEAKAGQWTVAVAKLTVTITASRGPCHTRPHNIELHALSLASQWRTFNYIYLLDFICPVPELLPSRPPVRCGSFRTNGQLVHTIKFGSIVHGSGV